MSNATAANPAFLILPPSPANGAAWAGAGNGRLVRVVSLGPRLVGWFVRRFLGLRQSHLIEALVFLAQLLSEEALHLLRELRFGGGRQSGERVLEIGPALEAAVAVGLQRALEDLGDRR